MGDDDETHLHVTYASHFDMDEAFCARMRAAIAAGLESAPVGVITAPGTRNPKYIPTQAAFLQGVDLSKQIACADCAKRSCAHRRGVLESLMKLDEPEQHKLKLEAEIASASAAAPRLHPNLAEIYRKKVDSLQEARSDPETRSEAIEILRGLIEPSGPEGRKIGPYRSSVKVVAGARNRREFPISVPV